MGALPGAGDGILRPGAASADRLSTRAGNESCQAKEQYARAVQAARPETQIRLPNRSTACTAASRTFSSDFDDAPDLAFEIGNLARETRLESFGMKPVERPGVREPVTDREHLGEKRVNVSFQAGFPRFAAFLNALERHHPVVFVQTFTIDRPAGSGCAAASGHGTGGPDGETPGGRTMNDIKECSVRPEPLARRLRHRTTPGIPTTSLRRIRRLSRKRSCPSRGQTRERPISESRRDEQSLSRRNLKAPQVGSRQGPPPEDPDGGDPGPGPDAGVPAEESVESVVRRTGTRRCVDHRGSGSERRRRDCLGDSAALSAGRPRSHAAAGARRGGATDEPVAAAQTPRS